MYTLPSPEREVTKQYSEPRSFHRGYSQGYGSGVTDRNRGDWEVAVTAKAHSSMGDDSWEPQARRSPCGLRRPNRSEKSPSLSAIAQPLLGFICSSVKHRRCPANLASFSIPRCVTFVYFPSLRNFSLPAGRIASVVHQVLG